MALKVFGRKKGTDPPAPLRMGAGQPALAPDYQPAELEQPHPDSLHRLIQQRRFAVLIAGQQRWADHPEYNELRQQAEHALEEEDDRRPEACR